MTHHFSAVGEHWLDDNGNFHREDGPASVGVNGFRAWHKHGIYHRVGGPAVIEGETGNQFWYQNGKLHRDDGPAITNNDGREYWFLSGAEISDEVISWMDECSIGSNWKEWTDAEKTMFRLRFV